MGPHAISGRGSPADRPGPGTVRRPPWLSPRPTSLQVWGSQPPQSPEPILIMSPLHTLFSWGVLQPQPPRTQCSNGQRRPGVRTAASSPVAEPQCPHVPMREGSAGRCLCSPSTHPTRLLSASGDPVVQLVPREVEGRRRTPVPPVQ